MDFVTDTSISSNNFRRVAKGDGVAPFVELRCKVDELPYIQRSLREWLRQIDVLMAALDKVPVD